ncbi:hypothetical protein ElyMa_000673600, partial [Elysia marginata]
MAPETPVLKLSENDLTFPSLYPEGTLVVKIWGPQATRATHTIIQRQVAALTGTTPFN